MLPLDPMLVCKRRQWRELKEKHHHTDLDAGAVGHGVDSMWSVLRAVIPILQTVSALAVRITAPGQTPALECFPSSLFSGSMVKPLEGLLAQRRTSIKP